MENDPLAHGERPLLIDYGPVQLCVHGAGREAFGRRIMDNLDEVSARALKMMATYLGERFQRPSDFVLNGVEVYEAATPEQGDFLLCYIFEDDQDEFGYTAFEVNFVNHEPLGDPFWPFKFTIRYQ